MNNIRELREQKNLKQEDLSKIIGVTRSTVGKYEREELEPNISILFNLADFFEISLDYLLGRENEFGVIENKSAVSPELSKEDMELIKNIHKLSSLQRKALDMTIKSYLVDSDEAIITTNKTNSKL